MFALSTVQTIKGNLSAVMKTNESMLQVQDRSDLNKMTSSNLAVVFGPNLVWSENSQMSLSAIGPINAFTEYVLSHHEDVFIL